MVAELAEHGLLATEANPNPRTLAYPDLGKLTYLQAVIKVRPSTVRGHLTRPLSHAPPQNLWRSPYAEDSAPAKQQLQHLSRVAWLWVSGASCMAKRVVACCAGDPAHVPARGHWAGPRLGVP